jgi:hypothetical protein
MVEERFPPRGMRVAYEAQKTSWLGPLFFEMRPQTLLTTA